MPKCLPLRRENYINRRSCQRLSIRQGFPAAGDHDLNAAFARQHAGMPTSIKHVKLFAVLLFIRSLNAAATRTFFQPDEFFQSLEVAHRLVFGYGYETWEWRQSSGGGIRSPLHALIFTLPYWILKVGGLDTTWLLV